ncbi:MAG: hypothetical protein WD876_01890 [Candidatus Pacearchaeota archaeon]
MINRIKNKNGQIGEGLTWVVATIIIIIILVFSIFVTSFYVSDQKTVDSNAFGDFHTQKSLIGYLLTKQPGGEMVYSKIKTDENLDNFNGNLAVKIFKGLYENEYSGMWVGFVEINSWPEGRIGNDYFDRTSLIALDEKLIYFIIKSSQEKGVSVMFIK